MQNQLTFEIVSGFSAAVPTIKITCLIQPVTVDYIHASTQPIRWWLRKVQDIILIQAHYPGLSIRTRETSFPHRNPLRSHKTQLGAA